MKNIALLITLSLLSLNVFGAEISQSEKEFRMAHINEVMMTPIFCEAACKAICTTDCRIVNGEQVCEESCSTICEELCN